MRQLSRVSLAAGLLLLGSASVPVAAEQSPESALLEGRVSVEEGQALTNGLDVSVSAWPAPTSSWFAAALDPLGPLIQPLARTEVDTETGLYRLKLPVDRRYRLVAEGPGLAPREVVLFANQPRTLVPEASLRLGRECRIGPVPSSLPAAVWSPAESDDDLWRAATQLLVLEGEHSTAWVGPERHYLAVSPGHEVAPPEDGEDCRLTVRHLPIVEPPFRFAAAEARTNAHDAVRVSVRSSSSVTPPSTLVWIAPRAATWKTAKTTLQKMSTLFTAANPLHPLVPDVALVDERGTVLLLPESDKGLPDDRWSVQAWAPSHLLTRQPSLDATLVELTLQPAATLVGRVLVAGEPVEGATVTVSNPTPWLVAGALPGHGAWTRSDGSYRLENLRPDHLRVEAAKAGVGRDAAGVFLSPFGTARRDFLLASGVTVRGRAVTSTGEAVAGAEVAVPRSALHVGRPSQWSVVASGHQTMGRIAYSNDGGKFSLELPPARTDTRRSLVVAAQGRLPRTLRLDSATKTDRGIELGDVVLELAETIEGVVIDASGQPVSDASVFYSRAGIEVPPSLGGPSMVNAAKADVVRGRFVIDGLRPDDAVNVLASAPGFKSQIAYGLRPHRPAEVRLLAASSLILDVQDKSGEIARCSVVVLTPMGARGGSGSVRQPCTDRPEQRIEGLDSGQHTLVVGSFEYELYRDVVDVPPVGEEARVVVSLESLQAHVAGWLLSDSGALAGAGVKIGGKVFVSDERGRFNAVARSGSHVVEIEHPATGAITSHRAEFVRGTNEVTFDLSERRLDGWVLDADGTPVPGASIALRGVDLVGTFETVTGIDGSFLVSAPHGRYRVEVAGPAGELNAQVDLRRGSVSGRVLRCEQTGRIKVVVLGLAEGEEARISYSRSPLEVGRRAMLYSTQELAPPTIQVPLGYWYVSAATTSTEGRGHSIVELTTTEPEAVAEIVLGEHKADGLVLVDGLPTPGVAVFLVGYDSSSVRSVATGAGGHFEFGGVESGKYFLSTGTSVSEIRVPSHQPIVVDLKTGSAEIEVLNEAGVTVPGANVEIWPARVEWSIANRLSAVRRYLSSSEPVWTGPIPAGAYRLRVSGAGIQETEMIVHVGYPPEPIQALVRPIR